jgi:hypothetical protein
MQIPFKQYSYPYKQENTEYHSSDFGVFVVSFPILISGKENKKNIRKI